MTKMKAWFPVILWALLSALTGPLWVVGAALAWSRWAVDSVVAWGIRWGFWFPTRGAWRGMLGAYRRAVATATPEIADEVERRRKAKDIFRRARRAGGGR